MATLGPGDISAPLITHSALPNPLEDSGVQPISARQRRIQRGMDAERLQSERQRKGWTQEQLADKIGVPVSEVQRWENAVSYPGKDFRRKLADLLGADIYGILDEDRGAKVGKQGAPLPPQPTPASPTEGQSAPLPVQHTPAPPAKEAALPSVEIFCCYARKDQELLNDLKAHLTPLQRQRLITLWADTDISPGTNWKEEIHKHLNKAKIILLLISPDFMASEYCYSIEMKQALERHKQGKARVIPVILRHVYWQGEPLGELQALPKDGKPVTDRYWYNLDEAFLNVIEGIRKAVERLRE